jgi:AraC-like DNA-binding protein
MVISRQQLELAGRCIVERIIVQSPFRYKAVFDNEACFLFFKGGQTLMYAADSTVQVNNKGHILLNCGNYFADILSAQPHERVEIIAVHLYPKLLKEILSASPELSNYTPSNPINDETYQYLVHQFIESLLPYFTYKQLLQPFILKLKLQELLFILLQSGNKQSMASLMTHLFTPREANVQSIVDAHVYTRLSVVELATLAGMSLSTFKRVFQNMYGDSPANYLRNKKIEKAKLLLQHSKLTVNEICYEMGFNEPAHFNRAFKLVTGSTPAMLRANSTAIPTGPNRQ